MRLSKRSVEVTLPMIQKQIEVIKTDFNGSLVEFWGRLWEAAVSGNLRIEYVTAATLASCYLDDTFFDLGRNEPIPETHPAYAAAAIFDAYGHGISEVAREFRSTVNWLKGGRKVYEVSPGLASRLAVTDVRGVDCSMVKLPFQTLILRFPKECGLDVEEVIVQEAPAQPKLTKEVAVKAQAGDLLMAVMERHNLTHAPRFLSIYGSRRSDSTDVLYSAFMLPDGVRVDDVMESQSGIGDADLEQITNLCINTLLYIEWPDENDEFIERADPRWLDLKGRLSRLHGEKRERVKRELRGMNADHHLYIGAKVPFMESAENAVAGKTALVRSLVAGHWKMQRCGEGGKDRKLIRIEPYWRGPLDAPVVNALRKVV